MKKFRYRLKTLLKLKEHAEKEKQKAHALAMRQVDKQKNGLRVIDEGREVTADGQRRRLTGSMSVAEMLVYSRYLLKLKRDRLMGGEFLKALEKDAESKRETLIEASKQRQIYEKLKERQLEKFNKAAKQAMTKEGDEIAITNYRRKSL